jgi:hypothetical protein
MPLNLSAKHNEWCLAEILSKRVELAEQFTLEVALGEKELATGSSEESG